MDDLTRLRQVAIYLAEAKRELDAIRDQVLFDCDAKVNVCTAILRVELAIAQRRAYAGIPEEPCEVINLEAWATLLAEIDRAG